MPHYDFRLAYNLLSHPGSLQLKTPTHFSFPSAVVIGPHHHRLPCLPRSILKVTNLLLLCKKEKKKKDRKHHNERIWVLQKSVKM